MLCFFFCLNTHSTPLSALILYQIKSYMSRLRILILLIFIKLYVNNMMSLYMISNIEHICNEIIFHNSIYYSYFALFLPFYYCNFSITRRTDALHGGTSVLPLISKRFISWRNSDRRFSHEKAYPQASCTAETPPSVSPADWIVCVRISTERE